MTAYRIREVEIEDAACLVAIYRPYVEETAITFEYEVPSVEEFSRRIASTYRAFPYLVLENADGEICGYAYAGKFKGRAAYDWSVEVTIYLRKDLRGIGLGGKLYAALERALQYQNICNAYACIAHPRPENDHLNDASKRFHAEQGYRLIGTFSECAYKFGQWYDMIWMEKVLLPHETNASPIRPFSEVKTAFFSELNKK